jgi:CheY-like chemotaxis protein
MGEPGEQETGKRRRTPVVLVVEDDVNCRDAIRETLKTAGYIVLEASDGASALQILLADETPQPAVIVLDLWLPVMSGPELLKVLRGYHRLSRIPVILTSAGPPYRSDVIAEATWLAKPFDGEQLLSLVRECCAGAEASIDTKRTAG